MNFMNFVTIKRENKNAARARKSASLRAFFQYLTNKTHQLKENPVQELETPKQKKSLPKIFNFRTKYRFAKRCRWAFSRT